ncbi:MAG TPA: hypothetical protein VGM90_08515 [Kofleriaceae bacterium]|jgi:hypothetical protein
MKRDAASTIFRTVVFAGAMLGAPACKKNTAQPTTPSNAQAAPKVDPSGGNTSAGSPDQPATTNTANGDPCAGGEATDPCSGDRPRGTDDDGGGGMGRGFILS